VETTSYNSDPGSGFFQESGTILTLAEASWRAFSPFLSKYQWAFDSPSHSPRKSEILHAIVNRGKKGCCTFHRPEGYTFKLNLLRDWAFEQAINEKRKLYYVSYGQQALLYFDIDLHQAWQTPEEGQEAQRLLDAMTTKLFGQPALFWNDSSRGFNGYLKTDLQGIEHAEANSVVTRLESDLQRFLAYYGNLADFEIKGKVGFLGDDDDAYTWKHYGKLPIHSPNWSFPRLEEFKSKPVVGIRQLEALCREIERQVPQEVLDRHKALKKNRRQELKWDGDWFLVTPEMQAQLEAKYGPGWRFRFVCKGNGEETWLDGEYYQPGKVPEPMSKEEWLRRKKETLDARKRSNELRGVPAVVGGTKETNRPGTHTGMATVAAENHQGHQHNDNQAENGGQDSGGNRTQLTSSIGVPTADDQPAHGMPQTSGRNKRPPDKSRVTPDTSRVHLNLSDLASEPDSFVRQKEALFRLARYLKRVPTVEEGLRYIRDQCLFTGSWEENLDRRKARVASILQWIANTFDASKCAKGSVNVGKFDEWVNKKFPKGVVGGKRRFLNEDGEVVEVNQNIRVSKSFIACFMAVAEFAVLTDKNQDGTLPHRRAERVWESLFAKGLLPVRFCPRKWAVCRESLVEYGIIRITNREYHAGKAMEWDVGRFFPGLGLWKGRRQRGLGCSPSPKKRMRIRRTHNTWLRKQPVDSGLLLSLARSRSPP